LENVKNNELIWMI